MGRVHLTIGVLHDMTKANYLSQTVLDLKRQVAGSGKGVLQFDGLIWAESHCQIGQQVTHAS